VKEISNFRDPLFGGVNPEPLPLNLQDGLEYVKEVAAETTDKVTFGVCLDGDGDRIAAVDENGNYLSSHQVFSLVFKHLVENRKEPGNIVKTFNISELVDLQAKKYQRELTVVPIGFKHICKLMLEGKVLLGGEESGGLGYQHHIPERDGVLNSLLLLELVASVKKPLGQILKEINDELGYFYYNRIDQHITDEKKAALLAKLKKGGPTSLAGQPVAKSLDLDGYKYYLNDGSWLLLRASGTEPLLRIYAEGRTPETLNLLLADGEKLAQ
jgi:phosphomannomutase